MSKDIKKSRKRSGGFALALTTFVAVLMAALIMAFLNMTFIDLSLFKNRMCSAQAYYIAEAGVADAINRMRLNGRLEDTQWEETFPSGSSKYSVAVSQNSTLINSTGLAAKSNFSRILEVSVKVLGSSSPYTVTIDQWKEVTQ
jgi:type II secretory pathway component PulK